MTVVSELLPLTVLDTKIAQSPYKQRYIAGAAKCSINPISKLLTSILKAVKRVSRSTMIEKNLTFKCLYLLLDFEWLLTN
jgi:hypothetical protein